MPLSNIEIARTELLIVLEYLLRFSDDKHPSFQDKIIDYAYGEYGIDIRRQRIGPILEFLNEIGKRYPTKMPFKIKEVSTGQKNRYYVSKRLFSEQELIRISEAIIKDKFTSSDDSKRLADKLIKAHTNDKQYEELSAIVQNKSQSTIKYSSQTLKNLKLVEKARKNTELVNFTFLSKEKYKTPKTQAADDQETTSAYVYDIIDFNHDTYALMVDINTHKIIPCPLSRMKINYVISPFENASDAPRPNEIFKNEAYENIEIFMKDSVFPFEQGVIEDISFRFIDNAHDFALINESYSQYFLQNMKYRKVTSYYRLDDGKVVDNPNHDEIGKLGTMTYVQVDTRANSVAFIKWATSYDIATIIEITGSQRVVRQLLMHYSRVLYKSKKNDLDATWRFEFKRR